MEGHEWIMQSIHTYRDNRGYIHWREMNGSQKQKEKDNEEEEEESFARTLS